MSTAFGPGAVKLLRQKVGKYARKDGETSQYFKFVILVPNKLVTSLDWPEGLQLEVVQAGDAIVVYRKRSREAMSASTERD